ncbi:MAG: hypothetical protein FWE90_11100 [Defluviitaleaceae bacterium]|nr:hypothetical protein [Defluviitaleaceae bacterium]
MQAIQGVYHLGEIKLKAKPIKKRSNVIVVFTDDAVDENEGMSLEESLRILNKHAGSIKGDLNAKEEWLAYLDERYGNSD